MVRQRPEGCGVTDHVFNEAHRPARFGVERSGTLSSRHRSGRHDPHRMGDRRPQELLVSIAVTRFNTLLYRRGKYRLMEEGTRPDGGCQRG